MVDIPRDNLVAAHYMYWQRIKELKKEVSRLTNAGIRLGEDYEAEIMGALDDVEQELRGVEECIALINHLLEE